MRILFVCLGNICRSPTAEGVMRSRLAARGLADLVEVDSAGTGSWHTGSPPDQRSAEAALRREIALEGEARTVAPEDFERFDLLLAMDSENLENLRALAPTGEAASRVGMLREYDPAAVAAGELDVPDPYYGGAGGFEHVLDVVEAACDGLLDHLEPRLTG